MKRNWKWVVAGLGCALLAGCYRKVTTSDGLEFSNEPWVAGVTVLGGLVALLAGIFRFRSGDRFWGVVLIIAGPLVMGVLAPGFYLDRVVVNQDGFYSRRSFWWNPTIDQVRYDELDRVRVTAEEHTDRYNNKRYTYYFDFYCKAGPMKHVPLGTLMQQALPEIAEQFKSHGIIVEVPDNLPE